MQIIVERVSKEYATVRAVDAVSLGAHGGEILALLGPNGAGKSSLVRMIVGLTQPDKGAITYHLDDTTAVQKLPSSAFGYLPEDRGLYQDRTLVDNLQYVGRLRGMSKAAIDQSLNRWLERFELTERATEPMRQLSKGNQQKVQLIATLLHDPKVVILDEPFSGLDPMNQEFVLSVLQELRVQGCTVILSAHQMALVERMADKLVLMNKGKVVAQGTLPEVRVQLQQMKRYQVEFTEAVAADQLPVPASKLGFEEGASGHFYELAVQDDIEPEALLLQLQALGKVRQFSLQQQSLHDMYLQAVRTEAAR